jgi:hypothetical protein
MATSVEHRINRQPAYRPDANDGDAMPMHSRPIIAVRLIGPTEVVAAQKTALVAHFAAAHGERVICRTSTHPACHAGEIRVYLTLTVKEVPPR